MFYIALLVSVFIFLFPFFSLTAGSLGRPNLGISLSNPVRVSSRIENTATKAIKLYLIISVATNLCNGYTEEAIPT